MVNSGTADTVVGLEKEFDVEGGVVLARGGCLGWMLCEFASPPGPVLAGDAFGGHPGGGRQDRGDFFRGALPQILIRENPGVPEAPLENTAYAVDLPEVVAGRPGAAGLGVTTLRHLVLLALAVRAWDAVDRDLGGHRGPGHGHG
jgi:hypothetical protein